MSVLVRERERAIGIGGVGIGRRKQGRPSGTTDTAPHRSRRPVLGLPELW